MGKWFTFAPMPFRANPAFFWRDSGLYCRALQRLGHESKVILLEAETDDDPSDILRASAEELSSPDWWRALRLDGVIMVAWARHRDTPFVRAIAESGTPLVLHIDGSGNAFPLFNHIETIKTFWRSERATGRALPVRSALFLKNITIYGLKTILIHTWQKYQHLRYVNAVVLTTPACLDGHERYCRIVAGKNHGIDLRLTGYPIDESFRWNPVIPKQKRIIAIGRWEDLRQKRAPMLMDACEGIAKLHKDLHIDIFGTKTEALAQRHQAMAADLRERIHLHGVQPGEAVACAVQRAQISFFPSAGEGGPQALFECLACGVSTVSLNSPDLPGARYAADHGHADFATEDTTEAFVAALDRGLKKWERGEYSARQISDFWVPRTHVGTMLEKIMDAARTAPLPPALREKR